jgi:hypothetical protein
VWVRRRLQLQLSKTIRWALPKAETPRTICRRKKLKNISKSEWRITVQNEQGTDWRSIFPHPLPSSPTRSQDASHQAIRHFVLESALPFTLKIFVKEFRSCKKNSNGILALKIGGLHEVQCWIGVLHKNQRSSHGGRTATSQVDKLFLIGWFISCQLKKWKTSISVLLF